MVVTLTMASPHLQSFEWGQTNKQARKARHRFATQLKIPWGKQLGGTQHNIERTTSLNLPESQLCLESKTEPKVTKAQIYRTIERMVEVSKWVDIWLTG